MVGGSVVLIVFHINIHPATRARNALPLIDLAYLAILPTFGPSIARESALLTTEIKAADSGTLCRVHIRARARVVLVHVAADIRRLGGARARHRI
jgi:hypothetical protein